MEHIAANHTVGQRGQTVFRGFVRASDDEWLCVAPTRSGERYVAIPTGSIRAVDRPKDDGPARITIDASALVYDVRERARPATDIKPSASDDPDVTYMIISDANQEYFSHFLKRFSLVLGDLTPEEFEGMKQALDTWRFNRVHPWLG